MNKFTEFYTYVMENEEARKKLEQICGQFNQESETEVMLKEVIVFAGEAGFSFTLDEVKEYLSAVESGELNELELEAVAGGKSEYGGCVMIGIDDRGGVCTAYGTINGGCVGVGYYVS